MIMTIVLVGVVTGSAAMLGALIVSLRGVIDEDPTCQVVAGPGDDVSSRQASSVLAEPLDPVA